jgi:nicotinate phosphoribosyltransferase
MAKAQMSKALVADLYEFTMAASYYRERMFEPATFSLFIREYHPDRGFFVSAGLEEVLSDLESFCFTGEEVDYLEATCLFPYDFILYLQDLRFSGDVHAIPEGHIFFKNEPFIEITAPLIEAQIVETSVINTLNLHVTLASKAARCILAARGRPLVDFSLRRTQGVDAGLAAARSSYIVGFSSTSNVLAGSIYGIPTSGTMAHSYITSFQEEIEAFRAFARAFPENTVLLIDTYDTLEGARKAAVIGKEMVDRGGNLKGVRIDSGDIAGLSRGVRKILDDAGLPNVMIFASGGLDEYGIADIIDRGGDIDAFGVGTKMGVSADAPYTDSAYKLVAYHGRPVLKLSSGKATLVCDKQVYRIKDPASGIILADIIALRGEPRKGEPMLEHVMTKGRRIRPQESLDRIRDRFGEELLRLHDCYKTLKDPPHFPVGLSPILANLQERAVSSVSERELGKD